MSVAYQDKIAQLEGANAELAAALSAAMKKITKYERIVAKAGKALEGK